MRSRGVTTTTTMGDAVSWIGARTAKIMLLGTPSTLRIATSVTTGRAAVNKEDAWSADSEDSTEDAAIEVAPSLTSAKVVAETDRR